MFGGKRQATEGGRIAFNQDLWSPKISKCGINWGRKGGRFRPTRLGIESKDRGTPTFTGCLPHAKCSGRHLILITITQGGFFEDEKAQVQSVLLDEETKTQRSKVSCSGTQGY